jgi:hypothetical protein
VFDWRGWGLLGEYLQKEPIHQNMVIGPRNENQEDEDECKKAENRSYDTTHFDF